MIFVLLNHSKWLKNVIFLVIIDECIIIRFILSIILFKYIVSLAILSYKITDKCDIIPLRNNIVLNSFYVMGADITHFAPVSSYKYRYYLI